MKNAGVKIIFDDTEYSEKERDLLWGRFFLTLCELANEQEKEK